MASTSRLTFREGPDVTPVHWLPCAIQFSGQAPISDFFKPHETDDCLGTSRIQEASFRGRQLKGVKIPFPPGFVGHIMEPILGSGQEGQANWQSSGVFPSITYWNHDTVPSKTDAQQRCLEWLGMSEMISKPIDPEEVLKRLDARAKTCEEELQQNGADS